MRINILLLIIFFSFQAGATLSNLLFLKEKGCIDDNFPQNDELDSAERDFLKKLMKSTLEKNDTSHAVNGGSAHSDVQSSGRAQRVVMRGCEISISEEQQDFNPDDFMLPFLLQV